MITITYTINNDKTEYKDIFSKEYPLNRIVESLQSKHSIEDNCYTNINIFVVSMVVK